MFPFAPQYPYQRPLRGSRKGWRSMSDPPRQSIGAGAGVNGPAGESAVAVARQ
jgi:hypothetical protein